jgi:hypothetical protein
LILGKQAFASVARLAFMATQGRERYPVPISMATRFLAPAQRLFRFRSETLSA